MEIFFKDAIFLHHKEHGSAFKNCSQCSDEYIRVIFFYNRMALKYYFIHSEICFNIQSSLAIKDTIFGCFKERANVIKNSVLFLTGSFCTLLEAALERDWIWA